MMEMYQVSVIPYGKSGPPQTSLHTDGFEAMRRVESLLFEVNPPECLELKKVEVDVRVTEHR